MLHISNFEELEKFLTQKKQPEEVAQIQWDEKRDAYVKAVEEFYKDVETILSPLMKRELLSIRFVEPFPIKEEYIGAYETRKMILSFQDQEVTFTPRGTLILGAFGRIDMEGAEGIARFLWVHKDSQGISIKTTVTVGNQPRPEPKTTQTVPIEERRWKIATPPPRIQLVEFSHESFSDALLGVMRG